MSPLSNSQQISVTLSEGGIALRQHVAIVQQPAFHDGLSEDKILLTTQQGTPCHHYATASGSVRHVSCDMQ